MMTWLLAIFLGLVQGIAEFLPISSSGHLALFQALFGMEEVPILFDVLLHFGTLLSLCVVFRKDIIDMLRELCTGVGELITRRHSREIPKARRLVLLIIVACLPLLAAIFFSDTVAEIMRNPLLVGLFLCLTGVVLFVSDRMVKRGHKDEKSATVMDALVVGACQAVAIVPGLSRSGLTISGGLLRRFDRAFAVRFSFLLSLPAVLGATVVELAKGIGESSEAAQLPFHIYLIGTLVAAVSGYFAIGFVKKLVAQGKFGNFAYYCLLVGLIAVVTSFFVK